jgi:hypothetical protein
MANQPYFWLEFLMNDLLLIEATEGRGRCQQFSGCHRWDSNGRSWRRTKIEFSLDEKLTLSKLKELKKC